MISRGAFRVAFAAFSVLVLTHTTFGNADAQTMMRGIGTQSCSQFRDDYRARPVATEALVMSWALGFVSGMNFGALTEKRPDHVMDLDGAIYDRALTYIRAYCDAAPEKLLVDALTSFYLRELDARPK